jgi:hypothetical protein
MSSSTFKLIAGLLGASPGSVVESDDEDIVMQPGEEDATIGMPDHRKEAEESSPSPAGLSDDEFI